MKSPLHFKCKNRAQKTKVLSLSEALQTRLPGFAALLLEKPLTLPYSELLFVVISSIWLV